MITYKSKKRRKYLCDLIKYKNYINIGWKNKYKTLLQSYRYRKMIVLTLIKKRFKKKKEAAMLSFKKIII